ncbi:hypothetical protein GH714_008635 [Hevea brasiliensis]|uniref:Uncharacterized protein n=1 Tax=Hevea brasiliensis TaxID=3981 RepID=A0A6A6MI76_HEVBR|nr:hypothetical protein GH714_008635 [Hevea brasiliensis]
MEMPMIKECPSPSLKDRLKSSISCFAAHNIPESLGSDDGRRSQTPRPSYAWLKSTAHDLEIRDKCRGLIGREVRTEGAIILPILNTILRVTRSISRMILTKKMNCRSIILWGDSQPPQIVASGSSAYLLCWKRNNNGSHRYLLSKLEEINDGWFVERARKLKEISEVLAGPRWKNFIRRFTKVHGFNKKRRTQYQYDPQSYALNFDDGIDKDAEDAFPDFQLDFQLQLGCTKANWGVFDLVLDDSC